MKYTGTTDGVAKGKRAGLEQFVKLMCKTYGFENLGTLQVRLMRSAPAEIQKLPVTDPKARPYLSVHSTGRAADIGYKNRKMAVAVFDWLTSPEVVKALGIEEVHDYAYKDPAQEKAWGRGWRCARSKGPLLKVWTPNDNGGTPGGKWLHVELSPAMADDSEKVSTAFIGLAKAVIPTQ